MLLFLLSILTYNQPCEACPLLRKGWEHQTSLNTDSAIYYYHQTIPVAKRNNNDIYLGYSLINLGNVYGSLSEWDSAIHYNFLALEVFETIEDYEQQFYCWLNISQAFNGKGLYRTALNELENVNQILNQLNDPKKYYHLESTRGRSWLELKEFERSKQAYIKAKKVCEEHHLTHELNLIALDFGNVLLSEGKFDSARLSYQYALSQAELSQDSSSQAMAYNNLGIVAFEQHQLEMAREYLLKSVNLKKLVSPEILSNAYMYLAKVILGEGDVTTAKSYLDSAMFSQDFEVQIGAYEGLVEYHQLTGDYEKAFESMQLLDSLKNEQFNNERLAANKLQAEIDLNSVNSRLDQQLLINENQKRINWILLGVGLTILIVAAVLFMLFRTNFKLRKYNELLLKEQNHRVKNNLQMISSLLTLQAHGTHSNDAQQVLNESQSRINSVSLLHRMLYEGDNLELVNIHSYLKSLVEEISYASHRTFTTNLDVVEDLSLPIEKATSLGLIVNELVTNSIKHVSESIELRIEINLFLKEKVLQLDFMDNGDSFDAALWEKSKSFGNQLIKLQSEQLRGTFKVWSNHGFQYNIKIAV